MFYTQTTFRQHWINLFICPDSYIFHISLLVKLEKDILIEMNIFICFMNLIHYFPKVLRTVLFSLSLSLQSITLRKLDGTRGTEKEFTFLLQAALQQN